LATDIRIVAGIPRSKPTSKTITVVMR
jgi:hypothetical protein